MMKKKILLTAFCGTAAESLLRGIESDSQYQVLHLPNDKVKDSELLIEALQQEHFDYVISLGQRPNIKDKVHIETRAKKVGELISTAFNCERLKRCLEQSGLLVKISDNAGTSYCNELYRNGLRYILEKKPDTQMVFLHVPFEKNILDVDGFRKKLFIGLEELLKND